MIKGVIAMLGIFGNFQDNSKCPKSQFDLFVILQSRKV